MALLLLGVLAITGLQFELYPGHSYLQGQSQLYLPMLERLDAPGFLSRDLVASHPNVAYTIYDEVTLFLHEVGKLSFERALEAQQLICRLAAVVGVLLLALAAGAGDLPAVLITAFVNFGVLVPAVALSTSDPEPVPCAFAFGLILLAAGLLVQAKPLLAGLAGGTALIYSPMIAAPFWGLLFLALLFDPSLRKLLRPALTVLVIFALLLANLAQLQPGVMESASLLHRLPPQTAAVEHFRTPAAWVSSWMPLDFWSVLAVYVCGLWAVARLGPGLNRPSRWLLAALPLAGIVSVGFSYVALELLHWYAIPELQPTQTLLFTFALSALCCGVAGARAASARKHAEATLWFLLLVTLPVSPRLLKLLAVSSSSDLLRSATGLALALLLTLTLAHRKWRALSLFAPLLALLLLLRFSSQHSPDKGLQHSAFELASWAESSTWGSSMFLFPDAGRDLIPGLFRAASRRAVWVDWESGGLVDGSESIAQEWAERWGQTMAGRFSAERLQSLLPLPVDYYVLKRSHELASVKPVFANRDFVVYDAADLRRALEPLRLAAG